MADLDILAAEVAGGHDDDEPVHDRRKRRPEIAQAQRRTHLQYVVERRGSALRRLIHRCGPVETTFVPSR